MKFGFSSLLGQLLFVGIVVVILVLGIFLWMDTEEEEVSLQGQILTEAGMPASSLTVILFKGQMQSTTSIADVEDDGSYEFFDLADGTYSIFVRRYEDGEPPSGSTIAGKPDATIQITEGGLTVAPTITYVSPE